MKSAATLKTYFLRLLSRAMFWEISLRKYKKIVGFDCQVVLPATHDTGSAVLAMPCREETGLYISSGDMGPLMGTEVKEAICTQEARAANLTNEGGYEFRFRFLKNIMGLWMIQCVRHEEKDGLVICPALPDG